METRLVAVVIAAISFLAAYPVKAADRGFYTTAQGEECGWIRVSPNQVNTVCCEVGLTLTTDYQCVDTSAVESFFKEVWINATESTDFIRDNRPPPGTPPLPNKPTEEQCAAAAKGCTANTGETQARCQKRAADSHIDRIKDGETCFGEHEKLLQSVNKNLDGRIPAGHTCTFSEVRGTDPSRPARSCRQAFQALALVNCFVGIKAESATNTGGFDIGIDLGQLAKFSVGGQRSVTVEGEKGQGSDSYCAAAATEHSKACSSAESRCLAGQPSPINIMKIKKPWEEQWTGDVDQETVTLNEAEQLIAKIDLKRLGLADVKEQTRSRFRPVAREDGEHAIHYIERLKFLANWSTFLRLNNVTETDQASFEGSFARGQGHFQEAYNRLAELYANVEFPDPNRELEVAKRELEEYVPAPRQGAFYLKMALTDGHGILPARVAAREAGTFRAPYWPGVRTFGFAAPMKLCPCQIAPYPAFECCPG